MGSATLLLFSVLCVRKSVVLIEQDITERSTESLAGAEMQWASFEVDGRDLRLFGEAPSPPSREEAIARLRALEGVRTVRDQTSVLAAATTPGSGAPPVLELDFDGSALNLAGNVPDEASRQQLLGWAGKRFGASSVADELRVAGGASEHWLHTGIAVLEALVMLDEGKARIQSDSLTLSGTAADSSVRSRVDALLESRLPAGFNLGIEITVAYAEPPLDPLACQARFDALLAELGIEFEARSAELREDSRALLDELAAIARRCPGAHIEIVGHADELDSREDNLTLSQQRAESVMEHLVRNGVDLGRLIARGYGEDAPLEVAAGDAPGHRSRIRLLVQERP